MLVERRPRAAAPLCDLNVTESLRLRRRHGRVTYLISLVTERRSKQHTSPQPADQPQSGRINARTLPS